MSCVAEACMYHNIAATATAAKTKPLVFISTQTLDKGRFADEDSLRKGETKLQADDNLWSPKIIVMHETRF